MNVSVFNRESSILAKAETFIPYKLLGLYDELL